MIGTEYFLKIAKITSQQETPICPNRKITFPQNIKNRQSAKINSRNNFVPRDYLYVPKKLCFTLTRAFMSYYS